MPHAPLKPQPADAPPRRWRGKWIWQAGAGPATNAFVLFRREFDLASRPEEALLHISADTRYALYVNGSFAGQGPPQSQPFLQYYDTRDIARLLEAGRNCLGVLVYHSGLIPDTRGGLLAELEDPLGRALLATDATWAAADGGAWTRDTMQTRGNRVVAFQEVFDARRHPTGWARAGFDDGGWAEAAVLTGRHGHDRPPAVEPWSRLVPRDIPEMAELVVQPVAVAYVEECTWLASRPRAGDLTVELSAVGTDVARSRVDDAGALCQGGRATVQCSRPEVEADGVAEPCIVLDFGRVLTARPRIELDGAAGGMVCIGYAERLIDGRFNNAIEGHFADGYVMTDGEQTYEPFSWKAFRYLKLRFRECYSPVRVGVKAAVTTYPYEELGCFESGDETLGKVFELCRYTVRLCSNEFLMDTPWREQAQWLGDVAAVTVPATYACFGPSALVDKFFRQSGANPHPTGLLSNISNTVNHNWAGAIGDYSLWWVIALWRHYLYTGRAEWIHELYPQAVRAVRAHEVHVNEHGLIEDMPYWVFIDWADVDRRGECAPLNALYAGALDALRRMAERVGDARTQDQAAEGAERLRRNFVPRLWDEGTGLFADARLNDDELSPRRSEHANAAAIHFGCCDAARAERVIEAIWGRGRAAVTEAQPFFAAVVLEALAGAGRMDLALGFLRERWGRRMADRGATSASEEWGTNGSFRHGRYAGFLRSLSHAWSAAPASFLIHGLAGWEVLEPGCRKVRVAPAETDFDYRLTIPTPHGPVHVRHAAGRTEIRTPRGVEAVS